MAHNVGDLTAVLVNLAPGRHRGGSCAGAASRVVAPEPLFDSSSVHQFEGFADGESEAAQWRA
jgi:hypothetical protein